MYLKYGAYTHAANDAAVVISRDALLGAAGVPYGYRERWDVSGFLQAETQAELTQAIAALQAAYAVPAQDAALLLSDGVTETAHRLDSSSAIGGVRVVAPPAFPQGAGAEYSTFRGYRLALEADIATGDAVELLSFEEVLQFSGGGPRHVHLETLAGPPRKQLANQHTIFRATQSGRAVGLSRYPIAPAPLWPADERRDQRQWSLRAPRRSGPRGAASFTEFEIVWTYAFESALPLSGKPNVWRGG